MQGVARCAAGCVCMLQLYELSVSVPCLSVAIVPCAAITWGQAAFAGSLQAWPAGRLRVQLLCAGGARGAGAAGAASGAGGAAAAGRGGRCRRRAAVAAAGAGARAGKRLAHRARLGCCGAGLGAGAPPALAQPQPPFRASLPQALAPLRSQRTTSRAPPAVRSHPPATATGQPWLLRSIHSAQPRLHSQPAVARLPSRAQLRASASARLRGAGAAPPAPRPCGLGRGAAQPAVTQAPPHRPCAAKPGVRP